MKPLPQIFFQSFLIHCFQVFRQIGYPFRQFKRIAKNPYPAGNRFFHNYFCRFGGSRDPVQRGAERFGFFIQIFDRCNITSARFLRLHIPEDIVFHRKHFPATKYQVLFLNFPDELRSSVSVDFQHNVSSIPGSWMGEEQNDEKPQHPGTQDQFHSQDQVQIMEIIEVSENIFSESHTEDPGRKTERKTSSNLHVGAFAWMAEQKRLERAIEAQNETSADRDTPPSLLEQVLRKMPVKREPERPQERGMPSNPGMDALAWLAEHTKNERQKEAEKEISVDQELSPSLPEQAMPEQVEQDQREHEQSKARPELEEIPEPEQPKKKSRGMDI